MSLVMLRLISLAAKSCAYSCRCTLKQLLNIWFFPECPLISRMEEGAFSSGPTRVLFCFPRSRCFFFFFTCLCALLSNVMVAIQACYILAWDLSIPAATDADCIRSAFRSSCSIETVQLSSRTSSKVPGVLHQRDPPPGL